jgi:metal-responsive CopG/Arc/MetJ family transcriptional regulator
MATLERQPITARIQGDLASYLEEYRTKHKLATRTDALEEAIRALRKRERDAELREGYRQEALDYARNGMDPWIDSDLKDTLEAIDRG